MAEQVLPPVVYRSQLVEPGDAAPPEGVPFDPLENYDQDIQSDLKVLKRGDKVTPLNTGEPLTEEALEHRKAALASQAAALEILVPVIVVGDPFDEALRAKIEADREARRIVPANPSTR